MAILTCCDHPSVRRKYNLKQGLTTIGRHPDCDIVIDDNSVSRRHAQISFFNGQYFVSDLNSRNGTYVNKELIHQETLLFDNSEIEICDIAFVFHTDDDFSYVRPRPTVSESSKGGSEKSFLIDDVPIAGSSILQKLDVSSHYSARKTNEPKSGTGTISRSATERKLNALITVTQALRDAHEPNTIMKRVLDSLFDLFVDADRGFVALRQDDGSIAPFAMKTRSEQDEERVRISRTIVNQVLDSQQAILSSDAAADQRFDLSQSIADFRIRSLMCAPLVNSEGVAIGVIQIDTLRSAIAFDEGDLEVLVTATMQASLALQNVELYSRVAETRRLEEDLKLAHEVQQRFLPQRHPENPAYRFFTYYRPMAQVGGDYYDFIPLDENRLAIVVADVVGHGIAAAMLMAKISAETRFAIALNPEPTVAISQVNRSLSTLNLDKFVTLAMGLLDVRDHSLTIVNAGHMLPIHVHSAGQIDEIRFKGGGLPLGVLEDAKYGSHKIELAAGDSVVFYTDGVNECMDGNGEQLGIKAILDELQQSQAKTADGIGKIVTQAVKRHVGDSDQIDDICLVVLNRIEG
ncbi:MAG: SpoIIE family protein phosphatase [Pirellulaceae bacterium]